MSETTYLGTETAYWVIPADDAFSVEVVTPWDGPTTVSPFATVADVKVWIAEHRRRVQSESDMVVDADLAQAPLGKAIGLCRQRVEVGPIQLFEEHPPGDTEPADRVAVMRIAAG
jgi:hypothetical protein